MTIKVLVNDIQCNLEHPTLSRWYGEDYDRDGEYLIERIVGWDRTMIPPVFNRVGYYYDGRRCWREFKLPSGRIVAVLSRIDMFKYDLKAKNANERPIDDNSWEMLQTLIRRGVLENCEAYEFEAHRRNLRRMLIQSGKRIIAFRKRIKARKEQVSTAKV